MDLFLSANLYQGLSAYVLKLVDDVKRRGVVVGHDHRHHSERWAALTAAAFLSEGVKVYLLRGLVHTPLCVTNRSFPHSWRSNSFYSVPFSVGVLGAACGVMITGIRVGTDVTCTQTYPLTCFTASHNPKVSYSVYERSIR